MSAALHRQKAIGHRRSIGTRRPDPIPTAHQFLTLPLDVLAAGLSWLPKGLSAFVGAFACFGFRISRLLRFCPLAMAERPFEQGCVFAFRRLPYRVEAVLCGHPLVPLLVVADAVLR